MIKAVIEVKTVIKNGTVITMAEGREKIEKADIIIQDDTIIGVNMIK